MRPHYLSDEKLMTEYICHRISQDGERIVLMPAGPEGEEVWADLFATWTRVAGWDLLIETNLPEWVDLAEIYDYFRRKDMTSREWQQLLFWELYRHNIGTARHHAIDSQLKPRWDADLGRLWFDDKLIKEFSEEAENQTAILEAFQEDGWPHRIDDPIPGRRNEPPWKAKHRLRDTITGLNTGHVTQGIMRFRGDGTGEGLRWERCK